MRISTGPAMFVGLLCLQSWAVAQSPLIIQDVRVVDGTGAPARVADVVIMGERIHGVAGTSSWRDTPGAVRVDGTDRTVLPGLIDLHVHLAAGPRFPDDEEGLEVYYRDQVPKLLKDYLAAGVTAIQSAGDPLAHSLALRERIERGELVGPHLIVAGPALTTPGGHPAGTIMRNNPFGRAMVVAEIASEEEARRKVRELEAAGVDLIKFVYQAGRTGKLMPAGVARALVAEARKLGIRLGVHSGLLEDTRFLIREGVDVLMHGITEPLQEGDDLVQLLIEAGTTYVPTLLRARSPEGFESRKHNLRLLAATPTRIAFGTDTFPPMFHPRKSVHEEAATMVAAGMTPMAVLVAATRIGAEQLGRLEDYGTLEPGKMADLVIVEGRPDENIEDLAKIDTVIRAGKIVVRDGSPLP